LFIDWTELTALPARELARGSLRRRGGKPSMYAHARMRTHGSHVASHNAFETIALHEHLLDPPTVAPP
jgi:hypothetical protein